MPRDTSLISSFLSHADTESHSAVTITTPSGTLYLGTIAFTYSGLTYQPYLKKIGDLKMSLTAATDNVQIVIANEDNVRGIEVSTGVRAYNNADVQIQRFYKNQSLGTALSTLYRGKITYPDVTETEVKFDVIDALGAAGSIIGARPMSVKCPFRFKDTRTCTYLGGLSTCNKDVNASGGCTGRSNTAHFGGWYFPFGSTSTPPSGDGEGVRLPCFTAGTMVTMADGSERPIELVRKGDWVKCFYWDEHLQRDVVTAELVEETFIHDDVFGRYEYGFSNGRSFEITPEHPVYAGFGAFRIADWMRLGHRFFGLGANDLDATRLISSKWHTEATTVYNLHVRRHNTYFANGIAVHNKRVPPADDGGGGGPIILY